MTFAPGPSARAFYSSAKRPTGYDFGADHSAATVSRCSHATASQPRTRPARAFIVTSHPGWTWQLDQRIPSRTQAAEPVIDALLAQLESERWNSQEVFGVHLAVEEALVNAIKHGNKEDPDKSVFVRVQTSPVQLRIEIVDEGAG